MAREDDVRVDESLALQGASSFAYEGGNANAILLSGGEFSVGHLKEDAFGLVHHQVVQRHEGGHYSGGCIEDVDARLEVGTGCCRASSDCR